jgi:hypothetical protein
MILDRENRINLQLPTLTITPRSAWRLDLASRLGVPVAEIEASFNRILIDDPRPDPVRKVRDANGEVTTLVRFPAGYRPATHVEPTS